MIVAIDIRRVRSFGLGTFTRNLIENLARLDTESRYLLMGSEEDAAELGILPENFQYQILHRHEGPAGDLELAWRLERENVDLCHSTFLYAPWVLPHRYIVTVHDTVKFLGGNGGSLTDTIRFYRTRQTLRRAARILTVSAATRRDLQSLFGLPPDKVQVVYNALDSHLQKPATENEIEKILQRYSIHNPYVLYAGSARPHKNLPRLIEAFALVKDELREHPTYKDLKLLIIGDEIGEHPELRHAVVKCRRQNDVRFLGFVPPAQLGVFYKRAAVFAFPSLHEGFGLPPLEAMAHGTPVLASNVSSLPEVLGDAALLVNPGKVFDISRGLLHMLLDEDLRNTLTERGRRQVAKFSWKDSVETILQVYRETSA